MVLLATVPKLHLEVLVLVGDVTIQKAHVAEEEAHALRPDVVGPHA